jgi:hypothetical protein
MQTVIALSSGSGLVDVMRRLEGYLGAVTIMYPLLTLYVLKYLIFRLLQALLVYRYVCVYIFIYIS